MAANGIRVAALDNSRQFNESRMPLPVDTSTPTDPWIHDEHHIGRRKVKIADLIATQERFNGAKVQAMPESGGKPTVVFTDAGPLIHDGHHRVLKKHALGRKSIWVDAYDGRRS